MTYVISVLFIIEFMLILFKLFYDLFKKGLNFKLGVSFGVLFFIFIPVWVMILTGTLELSKTDFYYTTLTDVVLKENIVSSLLLEFFLFSIIIYLYLPSRYSVVRINTKFQPSIKNYLIIYTLGMLIVFIGSGLLEGGNWYQNRNNFFESTGALAVLISFITTSSRILIIASLFYKWINNDLSFYKFLFLLILFTTIDMFISGNRIYLFCSAILVCLLFLKRYPKKTLIIFPFIFPIIFILGYFASIFRHIRGPLFEKGLPTFQVFINALGRAIILEPPNIKMFFIGISESVNVNVIYNLFNDYNNFLFGATYLKTILFYIPRSVWEKKPESITVITANSFGGSSLVTTIIGELYMNFSIFGVLLLPIILWLTEGILVKYLKNYSSILGVLGFIFGILFFRMPYSDVFLFFVFSVILLASFNFFKTHKFRFYK